jgi:hypothetical protein
MDKRNEVGGEPVKKAIRGCVNFIPRRHLGGETEDLKSGGGAMKTTYFIFEMVLIFMAFINVCSVRAQEAQIWNVTEYRRIYLNNYVRVYHLWYSGTPYIEEIESPASAEYPAKLYLSLYGEKHDTVYWLGSIDGTGFVEASQTFQLTPLNPNAIEVGRYSAFYFFGNVSWPPGIPERFGATIILNEDALVTVKGYDNIEPFPLITGATYFHPLNYQFGSWSVLANKGSYRRSGVWRKGTHVIQCDWLYQAHEVCGNNPDYFPASINRNFHWNSNFVLSASPCQVKEINLTPLPTDPTNQALENGEIILGDKMDPAWGVGTGGLLAQFTFALADKAGGIIPHITAGYRTYEYQNHLSEVSKGHAFLVENPKFIINHPVCKSLADKIEDENKRHFGGGMGDAFDPYRDWNKDYLTHTIGAAIDIDIGALGLTEYDVREVLAAFPKIEWGRDIYTLKRPPIKQKPFRTDNERQHFQLRSQYRTNNIPQNLAQTTRPKSVSLSGSASPVEVSVNKARSGDDVIYHYTVTNKSTQPIKYFYIGQDSSAREDELLDAPINYSQDNPSPSDSLFSPQGWHGVVIDILDTPFYNLFWKSTDEGTSYIPPGASLSGFTVVLPGECEEFEKGHFTAMLDDGALGTEVTGSLSSYTSGLLFERGLPVYNTALPAPSNLNGTSNPNRANFTGTYQYTATKPSTYQIAGDDFVIGDPGKTYQINKIRVWMIYGLAASQYDTAAVPTPTVPLKLWGAPAGGSTQPLMSTPTLTRVWYSDGSNYQRTGDGAWRAVWQVDFPVNLKVRGGQKYQVFLDGIFKNSGGLWQSPSLCAAKAALSNNPQDGADDQYVALTLANGTPGGAPTVVSGLDANIQVFGHLAPPSMVPAVNLLLLDE